MHSSTPSGASAARDLISLTVLLRIEPVPAHSLIVAMNDGRPNAIRNLMEAIVVVLGAVALGFVVGVALAAYKTEVEKLWENIR